MLSSSFVVLHGGHGLEMTLPDYLYRVLVHLLALGALAALVVWSSRTVDAVRSSPSVERGGEARDR